MKNKTRARQESNDQEDEQEAGPSAIELLREDHQKVQDLFEEFEGADTRSQQRIVDQALTELEFTRNWRKVSCIRRFVKPSTKKT